MNRKPKEAPPPTGSPGFYGIKLRNTKTKQIHPDPMKDGKGYCFAVHFGPNDSLRDATMSPRAMEIARGHGPEWIPEFV